MRLSDFCNRLTIRAPCTLPDSRSRCLPASRPFDRVAIRLATDRRWCDRLELAPSPTHRPTNPRVELRLTANLQLQLCHNPRSRSPGPEPWIAACFEHRTVWSEPRSKAPPRFASRPRPCRPRIERAARPLTSHSTTTSLHPAFRSDPRWPPPGSSSPPSRQRQPLRRNQDAFPRRGCLVHPPGSRKDEPYTSRRARSASCQGQGTEHDVSRRLLQSVQPTSTTTNPPSPGRDHRRSASSSRWIWRKPPGRVGAPSASSTAHSGWHHSFHLRPNLTARTKTST